MTLTYNRNYGKFSLECWGNGFAYALTRNADQFQVYVQGDEASTFEAERETIEGTFPEMSNDEIMGWLWDQCDYGSAAVQK